MASNITEQKLWSADSTLAEPHFDEEATLLAARPVVPLGELDAKVGFSRPWMVGLALAAALVLGVTSTAFYYSRTDEPQSLPNPERVSSGVQGSVSEPFALPALLEPKAAGPETSLVKSNESARVNSQSRTATRTLNIAAPRRSIHPRDRDLVERDPGSEYETRAERRAARREAKELKRSKRERRAGKNSNEVLRIRDIFEGPARP